MADAAPLPLEALTPPGGGPGARPGPGRAEGAEGAEGLFVVLGAGLAAASHPLLYVKLLVQVRGRLRGGEGRTPAWGGSEEGLCEKGCRAPCVTGQGVPRAPGPPLSGG